jgi:hypothetical protein
MSDAKQPPNPAASAQWMRTAGIVILAAVGLYYGYMAIDGFGLAEQKTSAVVLNLEYVEAGSTYVTQIVNNRPLVMEQAKPEVFLVRLNLDGKEVAGAVTQEVFESLAPGETVEVVYQQRRVSGVFHVVEVRKLSTSSRPDRVALR